MSWAACQDWMCEDFVLRKTGLSVRQHQDRTIASYQELQQADPALPWAPVLQGNTPDDYLRHVLLYYRAGVQLDAVPVVGLGSVCRRQTLLGLTEVVARIHGFGIKLHGFGIKLSGIPALGRHLLSSDSMAWSFDARRKNTKLPTCSGHKNCANCLPFALAWREKVLALIARTETGV